MKNWKKYLWTNGLKKEYDRKGGVNRQRMGRGCRERTL